MVVVLAVVVKCGAELVVVSAVVVVLVNGVDGARR